MRTSAIISVQTPCIFQNTETRSNRAESDGLNSLAVDARFAYTSITGASREALLHGRNWVHNYGLVHLHAVPLFLPYAG